MSKEDITELKNFFKEDIKSEIKNLLVPLTVTLKIYLEKTDHLQEQMDDLKSSVMDLQEIVLRTDHYLQNELFMHLRSLEKKDKKLDRRLKDVERVVFN